MNGLEKYNNMLEQSLPTKTDIQRAEPARLKIYHEQVASALIELKEILRTAEIEYRTQGIRRDHHWVAMTGKRKREAGQLLSLIQYRLSVENQKENIKKSQILNNPEHVYYKSYYAAGRELLPPELHKQLIDKTIERVKSVKRFNINNAFDMLSYESLIFLLERLDFSEGFMGVGFATNFKEELEAATARKEAERTKNGLTNVRRSP